jgi:ethanolamine utilization microcompartment shell protein EutL
LGIFKQQIPPKAVKNDVLKIVNVDKKFAQNFQTTKSQKSIGIKRNIP